MDTDAWLVVLYVVAGLLEVAGVLTVAFDVRSSRRAARRFVDETDALHEREAGAQYPQVAMTWDRIDRVPDAITAALVGGARWRLVGVSLLLAGIVIATIANVWAVRCNC